MILKGAKIISCDEAKNIIGDNRPVMGNATLGDSDEDVTVYAGTKDDVSSRKSGYAIQKLAIIFNERPVPSMHDECITYWGVLYVVKDNHIVIFIPYDNPDNDTYIYTRLDSNAMKLIVIDLLK